MSDTLLNEGTLLSPDPHGAGTFVSRSGTVDGQMARGSGFTLTSFVKGYVFLFFGASGELVAGSARSSGGRTISVSSDDGATWTDRGTPDATYSPSVGWLTAAGSWIVLCGVTLYRSTDQGNTWTSVLTIGTGSGLLDQGFAEGPAGTLYVAEYQGTGRIWQSTDDGVTWAQHSQFLTTDHGDAAGPNTVRHIHGIAYLPSGLWVYTGDNNTEAGLWKWSGSAWVRQTPSSTVTLSLSSGARSASPNATATFTGCRTARVAPSSLSSVTLPRPTRATGRRSLMCLRAAGTSARCRTARSSSAV